MLDTNQTPSWIDFIKNYDSGKVGLQFFKEEQFTTFLKIMHKQFKKFGFFAPANTADSIKNDSKINNLQFLLSKDLGGLSKQERHALKKYCKISKVPTKTKVNDNNKHDEGKKANISHHRHHSHKKETSKESNDGQIFFISPQDIKRHREHKSREKINTNSEHKSKKRHHHHHHHRNNPLKVKSKPSTLLKIENYEGSKPFISKSGKGNGDAVGHKSKERKKSSVEQSSGLNPKEIAQIINKNPDVASTSCNSASLNEYFIFEAVEKKRNKDNRCKVHHSKEKHKHKNKTGNNNNKEDVEVAEVKLVDHSSSVFRNYLSEVHKVLNKNVIDILKIPDDVDATNKIDVMFERGHLQMGKQFTDEAIATEDKDQKHPSHKKIHEIQLSSSSSVIQKKHKHQNKQKLPKSDSNSERKSQHKSPRNKKKTLVQKINSIIEILPSPFYKIEDPVERKKKLLPFQKYYKYSSSDRFNSSEFEMFASRTSAFSDSHKMYQPISDQSDVEGNKTHETIHTNSKIPKPKSNSKKISKSRNCSTDRNNCLRISRDKVSRELKTTKTKCKIVENANNLPSFKQSETTTTCPSIDNEESFSTTTNSVQVEFIGKQETLNTSPVDSYEIVYHENDNQPKKKKTKKKHFKDSSPKSAPVKKIKNVQHSSKSETNLSENSDKKSSLMNKSPNRKSTSNYSNSRSVSLDRFGESPRNPTTLLLTKNYKDQEKVNRFQKSRLYSETVRKNLLKNQNGGKIVPPQVLEVRFLTVSNNNTIRGDLSEKHNYIRSPRIEEAEPKKKVKLSELSSTIEKGQFKPSSRNKDAKEIIGMKLDDENHEEKNEGKPTEGGNLPGNQACMKLISREQFEELFEMPVDESLNAILNENLDFLKKDFSYAVPSCFESCNELDSDDIELKSCKDSPSTEPWQNFSIDQPSKVLIQEVSATNSLLGVKNKYQRYPRARDKKSQEKIAGSSSAPGSEESGYSTVRSRENFFKTKPIKALIFHNPKIPKILSNRRLLKDPSTTSTVTSSDLTSLNTKTPNCSASSIDSELCLSQMPEVIKFSDESDFEPTTKKQFIRNHTKKSSPSSRKASIGTLVGAEEKCSNAILAGSFYDLTEKDDLLDEEPPCFDCSNCSQSSRLTVNEDTATCKTSMKKRRWGKFFTLTFSCIKKPKN